MTKPAIRIAIACEVSRGLSRRNEEYSERRACLGALQISATAPCMSCPCVAILESGPDAVRASSVAAYSVDCRSPKGEDSIRPVLTAC